MIAAHLALLVVLFGAAAVDADARLAEAQRLAAQQEGAAAADAYRALLADRVDGPGLRYNLGTLLLEQGDVGGAMVQLLAARKLDPLDGDVRHNLSVALEARADRLAGDASAAPAYVLGERTPPSLARFAVAVPLALLGVLLALVGFTDGRARRAFVLLAVVALVASGAGAIVYGARVMFEGTREAVIVAQCSARKEADAHAAESFTAHPGLSGVVVDDTGGFVRVRLDNGLEAWIEKGALAFVP
jgi:hypothetical protein